VERVQLRGLLVRGPNQLPGILPRTPLAACLPGAKARIFFFDLSKIYGEIFFCKNVT